NNAAPIGMPPSASPSRASSMATCSRLAYLALFSSLRLIASSLQLRLDRCVLQNATPDQAPEWRLILNQNAKGSNGLLASRVRVFDLRAASATRCVDRNTGRESVVLSYVL